MNIQLAVEGCRYQNIGFVTRLANYLSNSLRKACDWVRSNAALAYVNIDMAELSDGSKQAQGLNGRTY